MPKSSKNRKFSRSQSSTSTTSTKTSNTSSGLSKPLTPLRRFFFKLELLGSSPSVPSFLGKRRRNDELPDHEAGFQHLHAYDHGANVENVLDSRQVVKDVAGIATSTEVYAQDGTRKWTKKPSGPRSHKNASTSGLQSLTTLLPVPRSTRRDRPARVALQNVDTFLGEDAVIITALDNIPFNCHEELLSMSREELINVALDLNSKLPKALAIDTSDDRPLAFIRNAVEVLVGIRPEVPAAPLRAGKMKVPVIESNQTRFLEAFSFERRLEDPSAMATPLMNRKKVDGDWNSGLDNILRVRSQRLETLEEAEVEEESVHRQSLGRKRRRLSDENEGSDIVMESDSSCSLVQPHSNLLEPPPMPKEPIDAFLPPLPPHSPPSPPRRVLRSHSRKLRSNNVQGTGDNFSTAVACAMLESGYEAKARRTRRGPKGSVKRNRQASSKSSESSSSSEDQQRNSIVFPTIQIQSTCIINNMRRQGSSESNSTGSSSRSAKFSLQSTQSGQQRSTGSESEVSRFLSIKSSASSSVSKMSVCTRSTTRGRLAASTSSGYSGDGGSATSKEDLEGIMDVSL